MKKIMTMLLLGIALVASGCKGSAEEIVRPSNFDFLFEDTSCGPTPTYVLDTKKDTLIHNPIFGTESYTIPLQLTNDQMDSIYQKIVEIGFFSYPAIYVVPDKEIRGYQSPSSTTQMTVTIGAKSHTVTWTDEIFTELPYMNEKNLRELALLILNMIWSHPNYQQLPQPQGGCA